ncbi:MAG: hypothetical protein ACRC2G_08785, partial [Aestuariivirga sp.]
MHYGKMRDLTKVKSAQRQFAAAVSAAGFAAGFFAATSHPFGKVPSAAALHLSDGLDLAAAVVVELLVVSFFTAAVDVDFFVVSFLAAAATVFLSVCFVCAL